ncbi:MAG: A/G-specific adenine glycosylase [Kiritimatiellae bacterium]|jgi:A/G-specific adenine glycosylase|nr:A/G-specific adenine glycosylase [Kiritimatiellia bacterium]
MPKTFSEKLLAWYKLNKRDLPWRHTRDPYKIWISEIMLQQTTVTAVIPYFERWIKCYPTMKSLAAAGEQELMSSWEGLGYYSRVRNIHKAAKIMVRDFEGNVPDDPKALIKLPGFGPYTVGAVLSIAYGLREPIIDANVRRIVMRLHAIKGKADASVDVKILPWIEKTLPRGQMSEFNQAFMELGALICSRQPQCLQCPVKEFCRAHDKGVQDEIPEPKKVSYIDVEMVAAVIRHGDKYYIQQRSGKGVLSGLWEFPSSELLKGESSLGAAKRLMEEQRCDDCSRITKLGLVRHYYTNHRVKLHAYLCDVNSLPEEDLIHRQVILAQMKEFAMHSGAVKIAEKLG